MAIGMRFLKPPSLVLGKAQKMPEVAREGQNLPVYYLILLFGILSGVFILNGFCTKSMRSIDGKR